MDPFEDLPDELILLQALELPFDELNKFCLVSRRFAHLVCDNEHFWYQKFVKDYGIVPEFRGSYRNLYQEYSAIHGVPDFTRQPRVPTQRPSVVTLGLGSPSTQLYLIRI